MSDPSLTAEERETLEAACLEGLVYTEHGYRYRPSVGADAVLTWLAARAQAAPLTASAIVVPVEVYVREPSADITVAEDEEGFSWHRQADGLWHETDGSETELVESGTWVDLATDRGPMYAAGTRGRILAAVLDPPHAEVIARAQAGAAPTGSLAKAWDEGLRFGQLHWATNYFINGKPDPNPYRDPNAAATRADTPAEALERVRADLYSEDAQAVLHGVTGTHPDSYGGVTKDEALECAGELLTRLRAALGGDEGDPQEQPDDTEGWLLDVKYGQPRDGRGDPDCDDEHGGRG